MSDLDEIARVAQQEKIEKLREENEEQILKIHKMKFLISIIKSADTREMDVDDPDGFTKKLNILFVQNVLKLGKSSRLLNVRDCGDVELTYIERKALRLYVINKIKEKCKPLKEIAEAAKRDHPDVYKPEALYQNIADLKTKYGDLQKKLVELKNQKCELMKQCAELRYGPSSSNHLQVLQTEFNQNDAKANVLEAILAEDFISGTEGAEDAFKEISEYIDSLLEKT